MKCFLIYSAFLVIYPNRKLKIGISFSEKGIKFVILNFFFYFAITKNTKNINYNLNFLCQLELSFFIDKVVTSINNKEIIFIIEKITTQIGYQKISICFEFRFNFNFFYYVFVFF